MNQNVRGLKSRPDSALTQHIHEEIKVNDSFVEDDLT